MSFHFLSSLAPFLQPPIYPLVPLLYLYPAVPPLDILIRDDSWDSPDPGRRVGNTVQVVFLLTPTGLLLLLSVPSPLVPPAWWLQDTFHALCLPLPHLWPAPRGITASSTIPSQCVLLRWESHGLLLSSHSWVENHWFMWSSDVQIPF